MKKARKSQTVLFVSLILGAMAIVAGSDRLPGGTISYGVGTDSHLQAGFLPPFDPTLGTLTDVTYSGTATAFKDFRLQEPQASVSYIAGAGFILEGSGLSSPPPPILGPPVYNGTFDTTGLLPGETFRISHDFSFSGDLGASSFFVEAHSINLQIVGVIQAEDTQDAGLDYAYGVLTFTYTYATVPEPPSLLLAGIAVLLPLSLIFKKRLSKRARCA